MKIEGNKFLTLIVCFLIRNKLFNHKGKFKVGDKVRYNWKARIVIYSAYKDRDIVYEVAEILYKDQSGLRFKEDESCDPFWVRKLYFWESV